MSSTWFLWLVGLLALGSVLVGVLRNRRFRRKEKRHQALAAELGLQIAYLHERDFNLYGEHRGYPLRIEGTQLSLPGAQTARPVVKCTLPMVNPNRKGLRILRAHPEYPDVAAYQALDRPQAVRHQVADWLEITTNDLMFAGLILSEEVKISLYDAFHRLETGLLLLQDEELAFFTPELLLDDETTERYRRIVALLCDMKDELQ